MFMLRLLNPGDVRLTRRLPRLIPMLVMTVLALSVMSTVSFASTLIYYDGDDEDPMGLLHANMLLNLAGHFDEDVDIRDVTDFDASQMDDYDHFFYIGIIWENAPQAFIDEIATNERHILWIDANLHQLTDAMEDNPFGFRIGEWTEGDGFDTLEYKGRQLERREDASFTHVEITGSPEVYSWITDGVDEEPEFLCGGNLCYLAENPFFFVGIDDRPWVFADLLHEFYDTTTPERRTAMLRFEDLSAGNFYPEKLRHLGDELAARGVKFGLSVIPIFKDPLGVISEPGTEIHMSDDPVFIDTLQYLIDSGATLLIHGLTHQHGDGLTGIDYEFVEPTELGDGEYLLPVPEDSEAFVRGRIEEALAEFEKFGWRPRIWVTPHYGASHGAYKVFSEYFDNYWERPVIFALDPDAPGVFGDYVRQLSQALPYFTSVSAAGMGAMPESLGYIDPWETEEDLSVAALLKRAESLSIVRDGVAAFYYHPNYVEESDLLFVVDQLLDKGYTFVGPDEFLFDGAGDCESGDCADDDDDDGDENPSGDDSDNADDDGDEGCGC